MDQAVSVAKAVELESYAAVVVGTGTRYGGISSQMAAFVDQTGASWARDALNGKVGAAFTSTVIQRGGQETTLFSIITNLLHLGMVIVGLPYNFKGMTTLDEVVGGSPHGATTVAGDNGSRQPSEIELAGPRHQGKLVARTAGKVFGCTLEALLNVRRSALLPISHGVNNNDFATFRGPDQRRVNQSLSRSCCFIETVS